MGMKVLFCKVKSSVDCLYSIVSVLNFTELYT